jgi:hypothetical protein
MVIRILLILKLSSTGCIILKIMVGKLNGRMNNNTRFALPLQLNYR